MKLLELNLQAFGHFSDCRIDLSHGEPGLHLIYGPNEAGKSSALLAINYLLYGFPTQTPVDFKFPYKSLRIGGRLRNNNNSDLHFVRRKANQKSLRCGNDQEVIEDDALVPFLGDVDRGLFTTMFGINHERLRSGGEEIAQGSGRIGEMLFAAGAGVVDLQNLQNSLQSQMEGLLKGTGRSGTIHAGIQEYLLNRKAVDEALVGVDAWNRIEEELRNCRQQKRELDQQLAEGQRELERLQRIKQAGASIARWKGRQASLADIADAPHLSDDFAQVANQLLMALKTDQVQLATTASELQEIDAQLAGLVVPEQLLHVADRIESLRDRIGAIRAAQADRPTVELKRQAFEREAKEILRELDRQPDLTMIDELRLPRDKTVKIQSLGNQLERLLERMQAERKLCEKLRREISTTEERLAVTPVAIDVAEMRASLRSVQQLGTLESELTASTREIKRLQNQIAVAIERLPMFTGDMSRLECLAVPAAASIDRFEDEFAEVDRQLQGLRDAVQADQQELELLHSRLTELEMARSIPTDHELEQSRQLRNEGWQLILSSWQHSKPDPQSLSKYLAKFPSASDLSGAYYQAVLAADAVADALRQDADRVATKAKLQADHAQILLRQQRRQTEIEQASQQRQAIDERWREVWRPTGLEPLTPDEMEDWSRKHAAILQLIQHMRDQEHKCEEWQLQLQAARLRLIASLAEHTSAAKLEHKSLLELSQHLQDVMDAEQSNASRRSQLADRLSENRAELADSEAETARTEAEANAVREQWADEMQRLGLEKTALPAQANSRLNSLQSLFEKFKEVDRFRSRVEHIDQDTRQFTSELQELVGQVTPELSGEPFDSTFQRLLGQLEAARIAASGRADLLHRRAQSRTKSSELQDKTRQTQAMLDEMARQAKVNSYDELLPAAEQSRMRAELQQQTLELQDQIIGYAAGATFADFVDEVERDNQAVDSVDSRLAFCQQRLEELGEERDAALGQIRSAEIEEEKFDGSSLAAEKDAVCESIATRLEEELQSLAVLRVAAAVLKEGIERHRQKNQGPILGRASEIFSQITLRQFAGLQAEFNDKGEPVLAGIRSVETSLELSATKGLSFGAEAERPTLFELQEVPATVLTSTLGGERVLVEGMSDGTCDQLYLALRLASLEGWLVHHEPMPFIVDDILMNFDDARAVATLKILAELSRKTQVIFFTHHQHLVDLARAHLESEDLFVTEIGR